MHVRSTPKKKHKIAVIGMAIMSLVVVVVVGVVITVGVLWLVVVSAG